MMTAAMQASNCVVFTMRPAGLKKAMCLKGPKHMSRDDFFLAATTDTNILSCLWEDMFGSFQNQGPSKARVIRTPTKRTLQFLETAICTHRATTEPDVCSVLDAKTAFSADQENRPLGGRGCFGHLGGLAVCRQSDKLYTHIHICMCIYIHIRIHVYVYIHTFIYFFTSANVVYAKTYTNTNTYMHIYVYKHIHKCVYI